MKRMLLTAIAVVAVPALALANSEDKTTDNTTKSDGVMTEKLSKEVPTMTSDEKPMKKSEAPESETYSGAVGKEVPQMKAPSGSDNK